MNQNNESKKKFLRVSMEKESHRLLQINFGDGQSFDYFPFYGINERFALEVTF